MSARDELSTKALRLLDSAKEGAFHYLIHSSDSSAMRELTDLGLASRDKDDENIFSLTGRGVQVYNEGAPLPELRTY